MNKEDKELIEFVNKLADIFKKSDIPISRTIVEVGKRDKRLLQAEREKCAKNIIDLDFDTEYSLQEFRRTQADYFDEEGKSYRGNIISHSTMELMFKIINGFDNYAKAIRED